MGIEKTKLLAHESVYWSSINADIKNYIKHCATCLEFQQTQPKEKTIHHNIPLRLTLPSSILLYEFYDKAGSMCLKICYCNRYLMWLVLLLLCGHK